MNLFLSSILWLTMGCSQAANEPAQPVVYYSIYPRADGTYGRMIDWIYMDGKFYTPEEFRRGNGKR